MQRVKGGTGHDYVDTGAWSEWRTRSMSFLQLGIGDVGPYLAQFVELTQSPQVGAVSRGIGVLRAVREDMAGGYLVRYRERIRAETFSDFLDQAEQLMSEKRDAPAAVLAGAVLEGHLRLLCYKNGLDTMAGTKPVSADTMNADLDRAGVYNKIQLKIVTGWLGIRNSAAHGKFDEFTEGQVAQLISEGVWKGGRLDTRRLR